MRSTPCQATLALIYASLFSATATIKAQESAWISPDKQWEYKSATPSILRAHSQRIALDLSAAVPEWSDTNDTAHQVEAVWAPDSKRIAINYGFPGSMFRYRTTVLYQLRDNKWSFLRSPVDSLVDEPRSPNDPNYDEFAIMAKKYLPNKRLPRALLSPSTGDLILEVQKWTDANTAIFYAHSDSGQQRVTVFYTLKVDAEEHWKLINARALSGKETN